MVVTVQFFGVQRTLTKTREIQVTLAENARVSDVFVHIRVSYPDMLLNEEGVLITVNNKVSTMNRVLNPNDKIAFLPHVGGG